MAILPRICWAVIYLIKNSMYVSRNLGLGDFFEMFYFVIYFPILDTHFFLYLCMSVCYCVHICRGCMCLPQFLSMLFLRHVCHWPGVLQFHWAVWPVSSSDLPVSTSPLLGLQACAVSHIFVVVVLIWVLNIKPRFSYCATSISLTEPPPWLPYSFLYIFITLERKCNLRTRWVWMWSAYL